MPEALGGKPEAEAILRGLGEEAGKHVVFADYMGWAYAWAICCSAGSKRGHILLICAGVEGVVAESFAKFASLAMADSPLIHQTEEPSIRLAKKIEAPARPPLPLGKRRISVKEFLLHLPLVLLASGAASLFAVWAANSLG